MFPTPKVVRSNRFHISYKICHYAPVAASAIVEAFVGMALGNPTRWRLILATLGGAPGNIVRHYTSPPERLQGFPRTLVRLVMGVPPE